MAAFMKSKLAGIQGKKDPAPPSSPEDKKKKEEDEKAKKEADKKKKEDEAAAKKKKEEEEKAKKEADKASEKARKEAEKNATVTSKPAALPSDAAKKNWFSSVTALSPLSKPRSGSIIGDAPPQSVQSARSATPASATPPTSPSPLSNMTASPSKTRVAAPATLGRSSGSGSIPGSPEGEAGASRAEKEAAYTADGVKWCEAGGNDIRVKAGSLPSLVKRLTSPHHGDPSYVVDFLLTYRSFTTPKSFLDQLIERFSIYPPEFGSQAKTDEWKRTVQTPVRLRVFNVIKTWVQQYWSDFEGDDQLQSMLTTFINTVMATSGMKTSADTLIKILEKKRSKEEKEVKKQWNTKPPQPILPINMKAQASLIDYDPQELARQMTLIDHEQLSMVKSFEFLDTAWTKEDKETRCANLMKLIKRFNTVTFWVATEILQAKDKDGRVALLKHFILITKWLRKLNNFNGAFQVLAGLGQSSVYRLKDVWDEVPKKIMKKHEKTKEMLSRDKAYERYRAVLRAVNPPCVPYLGLCLSDLLHLEEAYPHMDSDGLINFDKRFSVAKIIREIQGFQNTPYCLEQVFFIRDFLTNLSCLDENELYQLSLKILPKADRGSVHPALNASRDSFGSMNTRTVAPPILQPSGLSREPSSESLNSQRDPLPSDVASSASTPHGASMTDEEKQLKERLLALLNAESQRTQLKNMFRDEIMEEAGKMRNFSAQIGPILGGEMRGKLDQWQKNTLEAQTNELQNAFDQVLNVLQLPIVPSQA